MAHDLGLMRVARRLPSPARALRARSFPLRAPTVPRGVEPLEELERTGAGFDTDWSRRWPARMCRAAIVEGPMRAMVQVLASPSRRGADRLADLEGPLIFAANHHSHIDTPLLLTSIPEPWRHKIVVGAAADYFFGTRVAGATAALVMGAIPIERARVGRRSADLAAALIDDGWSLLIYPEGGRSPDGWGQPFRGGAAYLSVRCGVPVVPIHVGGTGSILRKGRTMPQPAEATVTFGTPMRPEEDERAPRFASRIEDAVTALADEASTDWYSARKRAHASASGTLTGPEVGIWRRQWALGGRRRTPSTRARRWPDL
ncbi:MAG: lysophospholipid acyltransferase family protein [Acidimicrobiaceae bacterium]|nr:lysophospholipid acyltransferase family protein [Acidimicrobiaceae bacterium]